MSKKMLIDASHPEETRVAVMSGGKVEDFDFESLSRKPLRGNIYLARITRVEPSLQAAFVEYGGNRHGFLAFNEIHPDYYQIPVSDREVLRKAEALEVELAEALAALSGDDEAETEPDLDEDDDGMRPVADALPEDAADDDDDEVGRDEELGDEEEEEESRAPESGGSSDAPEEEEEEEEKAPDGEAEPRSRDARHEDASEEKGAEAGDDGADAGEDKPLPADYAGEDTAEDAGWHAIEEEEIASLPKIEAERAPAEDAASAPDEALSTHEKIVAEAAEDEGRGDADDGGQPNADDGGRAKGEDDEKDEASAAAENGESRAEETAEGEADSDGKPRRRRRRGGRGRRKSADGDSENGGEEAEAKDAGTAGNEDTNADDGDEDDREAKPARGRGRSKKDDPRAAEIAELERRYEAAKRDRARLLRNYRIQEVIKRRQIMLVQAVKEERGNKGAALTTYMSLAGRYGVLMPNTARGGGVSRKITNTADRKRLRKAMAELDIPQGQGLIIRTAGAKRTKAEIKRDYDYLSRLWETIRDLTLKSVAPCLIYEEASLIKRAIRDLYDKDTDTILVQGEEGYREAKDFMKMLMPSHAKNVQPYREEVPLFLKYQVEKQLDEMYQPTVKLKSGGYIVIQQTEALVSIDVNSGKATKERNVEATALKTNMEAAAEVARQCRLRDLAGLIVIDFIDMEENKNNRAVEKKLKEAMKNDRARIQLGSISGFGLLELSRQRRRSGIVDGTTRLCPLCEGAGAVRSVEMAALRILRSVEEEALKGKAGVITASAAMDVSLYILNQKRDWLNRIESTYGLSVEVFGDVHKNGDQYELSTRGEPTAPQSLRQASAAEMALMNDVEADEDEEAPSSGAPSSDDASRGDAASGDKDDQDEERGRRRRRRGGRGRARDDDAEDKGEDRGKGEDKPAAASSKEDEDEASASGKEATDKAGSDDDDNGDDKPKKRRRRGRRGGRRNRKSRDDAQNEGEGDSGGEEKSEDDQPSGKDDAEAERPAAAAAAAEAPQQADPSREAPAPGGEAEEEKSAEAEPAATAATPDEGPQDEEPRGEEPEAADAGTATEAEAPAPSDEAAAEAPASKPDDRREEEEAAADGPKRGGWWQRALGR